MVEKRLPWILVVDDNEANRYAVARVLRNAGFETSEATTGRQALRLAQRDPDVIVLDVNLPDVHGFDVVRELRSEPRTALIPILHLSASYMGDADRVLGLDNGANAYLTHPIEPTVFVATIRSLVRVRRIEEERQGAAAEWQATFDAISDSVCVVDRGGAITRANRAAVIAFRRPLGEVLGKQWAALMCQAHPGLDEKTLSEAIGAREPAARELDAGDRCLRIAIDPLPEQSTYQGAVVCVVSDITERRKAEEDREAALAAAERARIGAEAANNSKSDFLATMSHEIRTPINAILGYAQLLDMGIAGSVSDEQRAQLDRLRRSAAHLLSLVNEVFDLASVDAGHLRVQRDQVSADEVIEDALAIGRPLALARGISIDERDAMSRLLFVGDVGRARQILVNLLSNAVKFSAPGSQIVLTSEIAVPPDHAVLDPDRHYVAIRIHDAGIGISRGQMNSIFEPFYQGQTGRTRTWDGSGLGLTISRRLARLMSGDLTVASELGRGSSFTLWLPSVDDQALIATSEQATSRGRRAPFDPTMFAELGRILSSECLVVGQAVAARLRTTEGFAVGGLSDAQLVDHIPAYVTDLGLALVIVSEVGLEASGLLHDGNAIRNEIAERHGAQRRRIGWDVAQVDREYDILVEELGDVLRARRPVSEAQVDGAIELISRLIAQSRAASMRAHRDAAANPA